MRGYRLLRLTHFRRPGLNVVGGISGPDSVTRISYVKRHDLARLHPRRSEGQAGKPVVRGTRLAVDFLLDLFAKGWTREEVLKAYPQLTPEALQAVFAFAAEVLHDNRVYAARRATRVLQDG